MSVIECRRRNDMGKYYRKTVHTFVTLSGTMPGIWLAD